MYAFIKQCSVFTVLVSNITTLWGLTLTKDLPLNNDLMIYKDENLDGYRYCCADTLMHR